mgnify:CR=1 FL=1
MPFPLEWEVEVKKDGNIYALAFERGKTVEKMHVIGQAKETGSKTTFWPDPDIFEETVFNFDTLEHRLREMAFLNKGIRITLTDKRDGEEEKERIPL